MKEYFFFQTLYEGMAVNEFEIPTYVPDWRKLRPISGPVRAKSVNSSAYLLNKDSLMCDSAKQKKIIRFAGISGRKSAELQSIACIASMTTGRWSDAQ
jgi:hypothetical protein